MDLDLRSKRVVTADAASDIVDGAIAPRVPY